MSLYVGAAVAGVKQADACMAVLVQQLLNPQYSFVLHTASPMGDAPDTAVAEIAAGLGETLASGTRGTAWRLALDKSSGKVNTVAFANFSEALLPANTPGKLQPALAGTGAVGRALYSQSQQSLQSADAADVAGTSSTTFACATQVLDYSKQTLSIDKEARAQIGQRIGAAAKLLEAEFDGPQDVEGCFVDGQLYVVQTRPQPQ